MSKKAFHECTDNITVNNCNGRIRFLEKRRDQISGGIDMANKMGDYELANAYTALYNDTCDAIETLCEFRRTNDCLLEGDPGYEAI